MKTNLILSITAEWPPGDRASFCIHIQQDGAKAHMYNDDAYFLAELKAKGLNVKLMTQPANSPDTNLFDLGVFHVVQSANDEVVGEEGEMIQHIQQIFAHYLRQQMNQTWLTFMSCLNMIIKHLGDNDYKIPHMNKAKIEQEGRLPTIINVTDAAAPLMEALDMDASETSDDHNDIFLHRLHKKLCSHKKHCIDILDQRE